MFGHYPGVLKFISICTLANKPHLKKIFFAMNLPVMWKYGSQYMGA